MRWGQWLQKRARLELFWNGATKELYELENYYSKYSTDGGHTAKFLEPGSTAILSQEKVDEELKSFCRWLY